MKFVIATISFVVLLLALVIVIPVSGDLKTNNFIAVLSSLQTEVCAVDPPYASTLSVRSDVQCAVLCTVNDRCTDYNYNRKKQQCDIYHSRPTNYTAVEGCSSKTVSFKIRV